MSAHDDRARKIGEKREAYALREYARWLEAEEKHTPPQVRYGMCVMVGVIIGLALALAVIVLDWVVS